MNADRATHTRPPPLIDRRAVDVWLARPAAVADGEARAACLAVLDAGERRRMARFRFAADRDAYLAAHALVRSVLSQYEDRNPPSWRFVTDERGRPEIDPAQRSTLRFNLSHTRQLVACAVADGRSVGIDVETTARRIDAEEIARRHFAAAEHRALAALPEGQRARRFLEYWTLKEAYLKARGVGLGLPLDSFAIELADRDRITISFDDRAGDDPSGWQFDQRWVSATESLAVAIPRRGADLAVTVRTGLPLLGGRRDEPAHPRTRRS